MEMTGYIAICRQALHAAELAIDFPPVTHHLYVWVHLGKLLHPGVTRHCQEPAQRGRGSGVKIVGAAMNLRRVSDLT